MPEDIPTPEKIWVITEEVEIKETSIGSRSGSDSGGLLFNPDSTTSEVVVTGRTQVEVDKLKQEMKRFLKAMRETIEEADPPGSRMQLDEVELSVEINGEGQVSLLGIGGKAGGKGAMTFKFKRRNG